MLDDEYDELPMVSLGIHSNNLSNFSMPPADVLASQRAREQECERELRILRELHASDDEKCPSVQFESTLSNSSELGGETELVDAVDVLRMRSGTSPSPVAVNIVNLLTQFLRYLSEADSQFMQDYLNVLQQESPAVTKVVNKEMLVGIEGGLLAQCGWLVSSVVCCSLWLCALCLDSIANGREVGLRWRRALHALLQHASGDQILELAHIMCQSIQEPQLLLQLSDILQGCPGSPRRLAIQLVNYALDKCECDGAGEWRSLTHVQLAGRGAAAGRAPLHHATSRQREHSDVLKVAVAACRLEHLCRKNNNNNSAELK